MSVSGNARAPTKLYIAASDAGTQLIRVRASGEAFLDLAGVESIELTIPDGALAATSVRCEASVWASRPTLVIKSVATATNFFPCRLSAWQPHCVDQLRSGRRARREPRLVQDKAYNGA